MLFIIRRYQYLRHIASNDRTTIILEIMKRLDGLIEVLSRNFHRRTEENYENLRIVRVAVEIQTQHLSNANLDCFCYTSQFGACC
jgi:diphthamide synthase subunit DPH2